MKALLLAATSSLALTGFAVAQTTTTTTETPAGAAMQDAAVAVDNAAAATGEAAHDAAAAAGDAAAAAGDAAREAATEAEKAAENAAHAVDTAVTPATTTTTTTDATAPVDATVATTDATAVVVAPDVHAPVISAENPGLLGSYIMNRRVWTTNQPSSTAWTETTMTERPADWADIAKVDDIVVDRDGNVLGYVADIGGFLGLGAKSVLLGKDALHLVTVGDDTFFATNYTKEELQALPDFDRNTVMK